MGHWDDIRRLAREKRTEVLAGASPQGQLSPLSAEGLLARASDMTGIWREPVGAGDPCLYGAEALLDANGVIYYNEDAGDWQPLYYQVHEFAHHWLHHAHGSITCTTSDLDATASETALQIGVERVQGYGPRERQEREANVFAREFLLPADALRRWYLDEGLDVYTIATRVGLPAGLVYQQLCYALLTPEIPESANSGVSKRTESESALPFSLDDSQRRAAHVQRGPLLVEAGPGTGKTRTLVGRILHLLDSGVSPSSILALTFSNKAAEEMRVRVAQISPSASSMWMGTFHAFGFELLSKYGTCIGLPPKLKLLDPVEAILALERAIPSLQLDHYSNLYEPTRYLPSLLSAISRAKDELVEPDQYTELAQAMLRSASTDGEREAAEKALEVARVYEFYRNYLQQEGYVDFGDLIMRAVTLLREHPSVREQIQHAYKHVLVDEYQDVNRASGLLLREIAATGEGLWAVGDARQAIYRFRGAAPQNMSLFASDFPGAVVLPLEINYRSQPAIVSVFSELAPSMRATHGVPFTPWEPKRPDEGGKVMMEIADDELSEVEGIAGEVERLREAGTAYRDQAILCRSHSTLARIGEELEHRGVPVLYLGDLFERDEVRDLLAFVDLACSDDGHPLVRVARFPEYAVPLADVLTLVSVAKQRGVLFPEALGLAGDLDEISDKGKAGLALLGAHLESVTYGTQSASSAWSVLARYLFVESNYLRSLLSDTSISGQQRRLAIFQLLQFALEQRLRLERDAAAAEPKRHFLDYVRRLEMFGEEKQLRQVPDWADCIDAVRLLTVHASKGLEFSAVFIPKLAAGYFPATRGRARSCPPPHGMLTEADDVWREEEEECLFFVALSRAKDVLCLSRALQYGKQSSNHSKLLQLIAPRLPRDPNGDASWLSSRPEMTAIEAATPAVKPKYFLAMLDLYLQCPRRYYYDYVLNLRGKGDEAAYARFHRCIYKTLDWFTDELMSGHRVSEAEAVSYLLELWSEHGPVGHLHEELYRSQAESMVAHALGRYSDSAGRPIRPWWEIDLTQGLIVFRPDQAQVAREESGVLLSLQRTRTGHRSEDEKTKDVYGLYYEAAQRAFPDSRVQVETLYLSTGSAEEVKLTAKQIKTRLEKYDKVMARINRGDFAPLPSERCPRCPHYFVCPLGEDG